MRGEKSRPSLALLNRLSQLGSEAFQEKQRKLIELRSSLDKQLEKLEASKQAMRYETQDQCQAVLQEQTETLQKINTKKQQLQDEILGLQGELAAFEKGCSALDGETSEEAQSEEAHARGQEQKQRKERQMLNEAEAFYAHVSQTVAVTAGSPLSRTNH